MPVIPVRELAKFGVINDTESWNLPLQSFSMAVNARFEDGSISRGPVLRNAGATSQPVRHMINYADQNDANHMMLVLADGSAVEWQNGTSIERHPTSGWTPTVSEAAITSCVMDEVVYINRSDRTVWYRPKTASGDFALLSNYNSGNGRTQFANNIRFNSLRATNGFLVGINVQVGANAYPTMVKWSNFTQFGLPPQDWDFASTSSSAGEMILSEMNSPLVDGAALGNNMLLYGSGETWLLEYVGGNDIFSPRRLFTTGGVINTNCIAEHQNEHYVFGPDDIYKTDGIRKTSLASGRVRKFIYQTMVYSEKSKFFAIHNPNLTEIMFCYVSSDKYCHFPYGPPNNNKGCNRCAAYNYVADTWTFYDLPYITAAELGTISSGLTWNNATTLTWEQLGGSWAAQGDSDKKIMLLGGYGFSARDGSSQPTRIRSFETYVAGAATSTIDTIATGPVYLEKARMDLDEVGAELEGQKHLQQIIPEAVLSPDSAPMTFEVGATMNPTVEPEWALPMTFDAFEHRLDYDIVGRFLSIRITYPDYKHFTISGFDLKIQPLGY